MDVCDCLGTFRQRVAGVWDGQVECRQRGAALCGDGEFDVDVPAEGVLREVRWEVGCMRLKVKGIDVPASRA